MSVSEKNVLAHSASGFNGQTPDEIGHKALKARVREFYIMSAKEKSDARRHLRSVTEKDFTNGKSFSAFMI